MKNIFRTLCIVQAVVFGLLAAAPGLLSAADTSQRPGAAPAAIQGKALKLSDLTKEKFAALPDSALLDVNGKPMTKGQLKADGQAKLKIAIDKAKAAGQKLKAEVEAENAKLMEDEKGKIAASNARIMADSEKKRGGGISGKELAEIKAEIERMKLSYPNASESERKKLDRRATALVEMLTKAGYK